MNEIAHVLKRIRDISLKFQIFLTFGIVLKETFRFSNFFLHDRRKKLKCNLNYTVGSYIFGQMQLTLFTETETRLSYEKRGSKMTNDVRDCKAKAKY